jgi:hypothetical protein
MGASGQKHAPDMSVSAIIDALRGPTISVAEALAPSGMPHTEGFYAWWASKTILPKVPVYPHPSEPWRLLYIGVAPGRDPARRRSGSRLSTLRSRVGDQHIGGNTGSSTLKLALAALLLDERAYRPHQRSKKVVLDRADNLDLTEWQTEHLRLTWAERRTPWAGGLEAAVIAEMQPPLNWQHNQTHPFWPKLDAARCRFRSPPGT